MPKSLSTLPHTFGICGEQADPIANIRAVTGVQCVSEKKLWHVISCCGNNELVHFLISAVGK